MRLILTLIISMCGASAWGGPTAHISGPSEDFQGYMDPALTVAVNMAEGRDRAGQRPATVTGLGLIMGVLPWKGFNAEVGADYRSAGGAADDNPLYFNAKIGFPEGALGPGSPALVGGVFDAGTSAARSGYNVWYAQAGRGLRPGGFDLGRFSAGWFRGDPDLLRDPSGRRGNEGLIAGWDRTVSEISERLWVSADYMGTKSPYGSWNFGVSWKFNRHNSVIIGYNAFNARGAVNTWNLQLTAGLGPDSD